MLTRKLWFWLSIALAIRVLTAVISYGPQSLDDYRHGFYPAYQWSLDEKMNLPNYRSPLLPWVLGSVFKVGHFLGIDSLVNLIRFDMIFLALLSLLIPISFHVWFKGAQNKLRLADADYPYFMFAASLYGLFPFIGTRGFGEAVSMNFLTLGVVLVSLGCGLAKAFDLKNVLIGFLLIGVATLFRFHVGVLYLLLGALVIFWVIKNQKIVGSADTIKHSAIKVTLSLAAVGFLILILQLAVDYLAGRELLQTLFVYIKENEGGGANYGVSPWYALIPIFLVSSLFPFTYPVLKVGLKKYFKEQWTLVLPAVFFVVIHCIVPHKEERFLYPVMGIWILFLTYVFVKEKLNFSLKQIKFIKYGSLALNGIALLVLSTTTSLVGEIQPGIQLSSKDTKQLYLVKESLFEKSFFKRFIMANGSEFIGAASFEDINKYVNDESNTQIVLLTSNNRHIAELKIFANKNYGIYRCGDLNIHSNWSDRLIYKLNAGSNQRRRPSWSVICDRT